MSKLGLRGSMDPGLTIPNGRKHDGKQGEEASESFFEAEGKSLNGVREGVCDRGGSGFSVSELKVLMLFL